MSIVINRCKLGFKAKSGRHRTKHVKTITWTIFYR